jgi:hypothetical protein
LTDQRKYFKSLFPPVLREQEGFCENKNTIRNRTDTGVVHRRLRRDAGQSQARPVFDRLAEKNKAMGSLTMAKDGNVLYTRAIGNSRISGTEKKPLTAATR